MPPIYVNERAGRTITLTGAFAFVCQGVAHAFDEYAVGTGTASYCAKSLQNTGGGRIRMGPWRFPPGVSSGTARDGETLRIEPILGIYSVQTDYSDGGHKLDWFMHPGVNLWGFDGPLPTGRRELDYNPRARIVRTGSPVYLGTSLYGTLGGAHSGDAANNLPIQANWDPSGSYEIRLAMREVHRDGTGTFDQDTDYYNEEFDASGSSYISVTMNGETVTQAITSSTVGWNGFDPYSCLHEVSAYAGRTEENPTTHALIIEGHGVPGGNWAGATATSTLTGAYSAGGWAGAIPAYSTSVSGIGSVTQASATAQLPPSPNPFVAGQYNPNNFIQALTEWQLAQTVKAVPRVRTFTGPAPGAYGLEMYEWRGQTSGSPPDKVRILLASGNQDSADLSATRGPWAYQNTTARGVGGSATAYNTINNWPAIRMFDRISVDMVVGSARTSLSGRGRNWPALTLAQAAETVIEQSPFPVTGTDKWQGAGGTVPTVSQVAAGLRIAVPSIPYGFGFVGGFPVLPYVEHVKTRIIADRFLVLRIRSVGSAAAPYTLALGGFGAGGTVYYRGLTGADGAWIEQVIDLARLPRAQGNQIVAGGSATFYADMNGYPATSTNKWEIRRGSTLIASGTAFGAASGGWTVTRDLATGKISVTAPTTATVAGNYNIGTATNATTPTEPLGVSIFEVLAAGATPAGDTAQADFTGSPTFAKIALSGFGPNRTYEIASIKFVRKYDTLAHFERARFRWTVDAALLYDTALGGTISGFATAFQGVTAETGRTATVLIPPRSGKPASGYAPENSDAWDSDGSILQLEGNGLKGDGTSGVDKNATNGYTVQAQQMFAEVGVYPGAGDPFTPGAYGQTVILPFVLLQRGAVFGAVVAGGANPPGAAVPGIPVRLRTHPSAVDAGNSSSRSSGFFGTGAPHGDPAAGTHRATMEGGPTPRPTRDLPDAFALPPRPALTHGQRVFLSFLYPWLVEAGYGALVIDEARGFLHVGQGKTVRSYHYSAWALAFTSGEHAVDAWAHFRLDARRGRLLLLGKVGAAYTLFRSSDGGRTLLEVITVTAETAGFEVEGEPGRYVLVYEDASGNVYRRISRDGGQSWEAAQAVTIREGSANVALTAKVLGITRSARAGALVMTIKQDTQIRVVESKNAGLSWKVRLN